VAGLTAVAATAEALAAAELRRALGA